MTSKGTRLTPEILSEIMERYDTDELMVSRAYSDAGTEPIRARLERVLINQIDSGDASAARSAIWANTVRDNIIEGMHAMSAGDIENGRRHLVRAANSLSAFADAQAHLDPFEIGSRS